MLVFRKAGLIIKKRKIEDSLTTKNRDFINFLLKDDARIPRNRRTAH